MTDRPHIFSLTPETLREHVAALGMPAFRAKQVLEWVYRHGVADPHRMTNLPAGDRQTLADTLTFVQGTVLQEQLASDGTRKLLIDWQGREQEPGVRRQGSGGRDQGSGREPEASAMRLPLVPDPRSTSPDTQTECVMIPAVSQDSGKARRTACVSSQIGCPVGCKFCASGLGGLDGNLTAGQIVQQVWQLGTLPPPEAESPKADPPEAASPQAASPQAVSPQADRSRPASTGSTHTQRITNVVFMGMGEPLTNFEPVAAAARTMMADWGLGISGRRITLSTVGIPSGIRRLAELDLPVTLAISLHAPNDDIRRQIIPWAKFVTIDQLIDAGVYYFQRTGREVTLEYILLGTLNDQPEHARELARVARRLRANINLIRYNEVKGLPYQRPASDDVQRFQTILRDAGVNTHIRASRGRDIAAACGQLRHEHTPAPGSNAPAPGSRAPGNSAPGSSSKTNKTHGASAPAATP